MNLEHWDTLSILSHLAPGFVNGDLDDYSQDDIEAIDDLSSNYPQDEFILDWKFEDGEEFTTCDISNVRGNCVNVEVYKIK